MQPLLNKGNHDMKKEYKPGVYNISNDDYHSSAGLSRSALWKFNQSPSHYWNEYLNPNKKPRCPTPAMMLGELVHVLTLEPHKFDKEFITKPKPIAVPKVGLLKDLGREEYDKQKTKAEAIKVANELELKEFEEKSQGLNVIDENALELAVKMEESVRASDLFKPIMEGAKIEQSIYFKHELTGLTCKVRPDIWNGSLVADLKTTADASPKAFQHSALKFGYYLQAGMIYEALKSQGITMDKFVFLALEKSEPYCLATYVLDNEAIDYGVRLFEDLIIKFKEQLDQDRWPAYGLNVLSVPSWLKLESNIYE